MSAVFYFAKKSAFYSFISLSFRIFLSVHTSLVLLLPFLNLKIQFSTTCYFKDGFISVKYEKHTLSLYQNLYNNLYHTYQLNLRLRGKTFTGQFIKQFNILNIICVHLIFITCCRYFHFFLMKYPHSSSH